MGARVTCDIDDAVLTSLQRRADLRGHSLAQEISDILAAAAGVSMVDLAAKSANDAWMAKDSDEYLAAKWACEGCVTEDADEELAAKWAWDSWVAEEAERERS